MHECEEKVCNVGGKYCLQVFHSRMYPCHESDQEKYDNLTGDFYLWNMLQELMDQV